MKKFAKISAAIVAGLPLVSLAQQVNPNYLSSIITSAKFLLDQLVVFLIALAVVWFIWNVIKYTMSEEEDGKEKARKQMIYGIVAIAVIISVWGLVAILQNIFGVSSSSASNVQNLLPKN